MAIDLTRWFEMKGKRRASFADIKIVPDARVPRDHLVMGVDMARPGSEQTVVCKIAPSYRGLTADGVIVDEMLGFPDSETKRRLSREIQARQDELIYRTMGMRLPDPQLRAAPGDDGHALFTTEHPVGGGTYSNAPTAASDLTEESLERAMGLIRSVPFAHALAIRIAREMLDDTLYRRLFTTTPRIDPETAQRSRERSRGLLRSLLTPEQWAEFEDAGAVTEEIEGSRFRLRPGGMIEATKPRLIGQPVIERWCVAPDPHAAGNDWIPDEDKLIGQLLHLRAGPEKVRGLANVFPGRPQPT